MNFSRFVFAIGLCAVCASAALAQQKYLPRDASAVVTMAGAWDLASADGARRCRISLNRSGVTGDFMLMGMPPPCRMALPQIGKRNGWSVATDGSIHIGPATSESVLIFTKGRDSAYVSSDGMRLEPVGRSVHGEQRAQTVASAAAQMAPATAPQNADRAKLAGRYAVARSAAEVGCALTLQTTPVRIQGGGEGIWSANLNGDCRDDGLKTFAPTGWRFENGRIFLVARKGHSIGFTPEQGGTSWNKDPPAGRPLLMKRLAN